MVPHRRILQIIALVAATSPKPEEVATALCGKFKVKFPISLGVFVEDEVYALLPESTEAFLRTTDIALTGDVRAILQAASIMGYTQYLGFDHEGFTVQLPAHLRQWREDSTKRMFIETCTLAGIGPHYICDDLRSMYGIDVTPEQVEEFVNLFCDVAFSKGDHWGHYVACVGYQESMFKITLMNQPHLFVRWKLGAPVTPDIDSILDRVIADSYFTERAIKSRAGENGIDLGKEELNRLKMERDALFKAMDRRLKKQQLDAATGEGGAGAEAAKALENLVLEMTENQFPLMADIFDE